MSQGEEVRDALYGLYKRFYVMSERHYRSELNVLIWRLQEVFPEVEDLEQMKEREEQEAEYD